ncbi:hypothetical protein ACE3NQ_02590 [Paenibacillus terreus]|uniref:Uncharacterized protein n=1 Tax=Paenibacillus terreus TaxID=1387834 RepID=A0ABV5B330_9BACL
MDIQSGNVLELRDRRIRLPNTSRQAVGGDYEMGFAEDIGPPA